MIRTVIESPFGRNPDGTKCTPEEYARNMRYLTRCCADSISRGESPYASHRFFPGLLDDRSAEERALGAQLGLVWGDVAMRRAVYLDHGETEGMRLGIDRALEIGQTIEIRHIGQEPLHVTEYPPQTYAVAKYNDEPPRARCDEHADSDEVKSKGCDLPCGLCGKRPAQFMGAPRRDTEKQIALPRPSEFPSAQDPEFGKLSIDGRETE